MDDIAKKLQEYDDAFDFYMDRGQLPDTIPDGDPLGDFIGQTIQDNPQLDGQDTLWRELLKEELMKFIEAMLKLYQPMEEEHCREKYWIANFALAGMQKKVEMMEQIKIIIKGRYTPEQVNVDGYEQQAAEGGNAEAAMEALVKDWDKASEERLAERKRKTIEKNKNQWESHVREHGLSDYHEHKKVERIVYSYPSLKEIVRIMGREQPQREDEMDETVRKFLPLLPSPPKPAVEIEEIATGNSLRHMMPVETAIMADRETESLFYLKYATQRLQLFANRPKEESRLKTDVKHTKKPRLEKGPIIVSIDTSGSMMGKPIQLAKCLLLQLLGMAKKQKRKCFLISFSVRAQYIDLSLYGAWRRLNNFLDDSFTGGTDGEEMLNAAMDMLQTRNFAMADVLIISDFYFNRPIAETRKRMMLEHDKGTRFYGLQIDSDSEDYNDILDRVWSVGIKNNLNFG